MMENAVRFLVFADFHYKKGMYAPTVGDLDAIMRRAAEEKVDFVLHAGDFSNDYTHSPEITSRYLKNAEGLAVYGVYGNHELESKGNVMPRVTPLLTNQISSVTFGTADGKLGSGDIAYYFFDQAGFRFIFLDNNYSLNPTTGKWEHNKEASWGPPAGNEKGNSLGPDQLLWLEKVLLDAAEKGLSCVLTSHSGYSGVWESAPDASEVRAIFRKVNTIRKNTVILAINGHYHTDHAKVVENVLYFDVNTAINGWWQPQREPHYTDGQTYLFTDYDENGQPVSVTEKPLASLSMSENTWFFASPLSAVVTVSRDGKIEIEGTETRWVYDLVPENVADGTRPAITSGCYQL